MPISSRPISISLSPNTERDDISLALKFIFKPWQWKAGATIQELEKEFKNYFGAKYAISFDSGRSSLLAILTSLSLNKKSEILLQAFTCNAVPNPVLWTGLRPVYVDCSEQTFNLDTEDLKNKISPKSGAVIVQHTFGLPAEMENIAEICRKNNLILIEDCAHSLGATYNNKKLGLFGKAAFFSFSRDKIISSVYGGMVITNDDVLAQKIKEFQKKAGYPPYLWILQQLLHPVLMNYLILPTYSFFSIGKILLNIFQWFKIFSKAVHWKEKRGEMPSYFPKTMPNALAVLALNQFKKLERFNKHRKEIADFYYKELGNKNFQLPVKENQIFLRFVIKHPKAHQIIKNAWQKNLLIGDWYTTAIAPHDTKLDKMQYRLGSCSNAEKLAKETLNLPTHINISYEKAKKITDFLKKYAP